MDILFLGYAVSYEQKNLTGMSVAGNKMQISILKSLKKRAEMNLQSITIFPIATFPHDHRVFIRSEKIIIFNNQTSYKLGFINLPILKQLSQIVMMFLEIRKHLKKDTIIMTFNYFPQIGIPAFLASKLYLNKIVPILADLPIDNARKRSRISAVLRKIFDNVTKKLLSTLRTVVVLNKQAAIRFAPNSKYLLIEGGIDLTEFIDYRPHSWTRKNLVYSGDLSGYSGIMNLIEAVKLVKDNIILDIYGSGELEALVKMSIKESPNIFFHGQVDNESMRKIQREAFLLISPRIINDPISNVTFPSKIMEYMMSGTPIISTKLSGLTPEYYDKMYLVESDNPIQISDIISKVMNLPNSELLRTSEKAKDFITKQKNWDVQCDKISKFLETL